MKQWWPLPIMSKHVSIIGHCWSKVRIPAKSTWCYCHHQIWYHDTMMAKLWEIYIVWPLAVILYIYTTSLFNPIVPTEFRIANKERVARSGNVWIMPKNICLKMCWRFVSAIVRPWTDDCKLRHGNWLCARRPPLQQSSNCDSTEKQRYMLIQRLTACTAERI